MPGSRHVLDGRAGSSTAEGSVVERALRLGRRMCRPGTSTLYASLAVADVDLDVDTVSFAPPPGPWAAPVEGVHALVWRHGVPVGEITVAGDPAQLVEELPGQARGELAASIAELEARHAAGARRPTAQGGAPPPDASALTVAVCTRDRPDALRECLQALGELSAQVAEILVVDNVPTSDRARESVLTHPRARYVLEPRRGLGWARNRALIEARTPLIAFVDDDVLVHPRWAEALVLAFDAEPEATAVTGLVGPAELATRAQVCFEAAGGFGRGAHPRRLRADSTEPRDVARAVFHVGAMGTGANMAFRRERVTAVGGFDPALGAGTPTRGGDDLEVLCRLLSCGDLIVYEPGAVVRHRHRRTMAELRAQRFADGTGSASVLLGAGTGLPAAHRRQWRQVSLSWVTRSTAVGVLGSLLRPAARPMSLTVATASGWTWAVARRSYSRSVARARAEAEHHVREPTVPRQGHGWHTL